MTERDIWSELHQKGLVTGDRPQTAIHESPWYVQTLLAFCGWLAAIFVFGFLAAGITELLDNPVACLLVGALLIAGAFKFLAGKPSVFSEHLALAASLAGQGLWLVAVFEVSGSEDLSAWLCISLMQAVLAWLMPNFVHRVFSAFASAIALSAAFAELDTAYLGGSLLMLPVAWLWLNEFRYTHSHRQLLAIAYGLTLALVLVKSTNVVFGGDWFWRASMDSTAGSVLWAGEMINALAMIFVSWKLLCRYQPENGTILIVMLGTILFCVASFQAQGLSVGLMIVLLGFAASNRLLLGLGTAALLFYVSAYYYQLQITLLEKAQTLLIVGVLMLAAYGLLRWFYRLQEADHG